VELSLVSRYVFRGYDSSPQGNTPSLQTSLTGLVGATGWSFNLWTSHGWKGGAALHEIDYTVDYTRTLAGPADLSLGYVFYDARGFDERTQEVYLGASWPELSWEPAVSVYYDFDTGKGLYAELAGGSAVGGRGLWGSWAVGYNGGQYGADYGISHATFGLSKDLDWRDGWTVTPSLNYVAVFDEAVNTSDEWFVGVSLSRSWGK
jgi:hypothetical protein